MSYNKFIKIDENLIQSLRNGFERELSPDFLGLSQDSPLKVKRVGDKWLVSLDRQKYEDLKVKYGVNFSRVYGDDVQILQRMGELFFDKEFTLSTISYPSFSGDTDNIAETQNGNVFEVVPKYEFYDKEREEERLNVNFDEYVEVSPLYSDYKQDFDYKYAYMMIFDQEYMDNSDNFSKNQEPYGFDINFERLPSGTFTNALKEMNIFDLLLKSESSYLQETFFNVEDFENRIFESLTIDVVLEKMAEAEILPSTLQDFIQGRNQNASTSLNQATNLPLSNNTLQNNTFTLPEDNVFDFSQAKVVGNSLFSSIYIELFKKFILQEQDRLNSSFSLSNLVQFSECIMFSIEKRDSEGRGQEFFFPNTSASKLIEYFDRQVKYSKNYRFRLNGYFVSPEYKIEMSLKGKESRLLIEDVEFGLDVQTKFLLTKIPLTSDIGGIILDLPPVPPSVEIFAFKGTRDIGISLSNSLGSYEAPPIVVLPTDRRRNTALKRSRGFRDVFEFKKDDNLVSFQVFRTNTKPSKYSDFEFMGSISKRNGGFVDNYLLKQTLEEDVTYYYFFRSVDVHGNISNPSDMFRVNYSIEDSGKSFFDVSVFRFNRMIGRKQKEFRRFLSIKPSFEQVSLDESNSGFEEVQKGKEYDVSSIKLGTEDEYSIWGKKYLFRIFTRSGKIFNLKTRFQIKKNKIKET